MCQVDVSHRVVKSTNMLETMKQLRQKFPDNTKEKILEAFKNRFVITSYNNRAYQIGEIEWGMCPTSTFKVKKQGVESEINFKEYYASQYNQTITDLSQPLILCKVQRGRGGISENC